MNNTSNIIAVRVISVLHLEAFGDESSEEEEFVLFNSEICKIQTILGRKKWSKLIANQAGCINW